jgi:predicted RNA binding protein YcfA (HicA-like mRNA interferase family)
MGSLPQVRPARLVRVLQRLGFRILRQTGSHCFLHHADGRRANIPIHERADIPPGTLRAILTAVKLTPEELRRLL